MSMHGLTLLAQYAATSCLWRCICTAVVALQAVIYKAALQDGTWAGYQEQVALARHHGVMIRVFQANQPAWTIKPDYPGFPKVCAPLHWTLIIGPHSWGPCSSCDVCWRNGAQAACWSP